MTRTRTRCTAQVAVAPHGASAVLGLLALAATLTLPAAAAAQSTRVDLTGVFLHGGGIAGSVSGPSGAVGDTHTGNGWGVGAGLHLGRGQALVANYSTFRFLDPGAQSRSTMTQAEAGLRMRIGGTHIPVVFYFEGGGARRRTSLTSARVFGDAPPAGAGAMVDVEGWAGWFGPGLQVYDGRRIAGEINVAWAWGPMDHARIAGSMTALPSPVNLTTVRLRFGLAATLF